MEEHRFDDLTRALGGATSRRGVLKGLVGGVVAAVVARSIQPKHAAAASCEGNLAACRQDAAASFETCRANGRSWFTCTLQAAAQFNDCFYVQCPDGQACCALQCTDTLTDPNHCGSCYVHCGSGQICTDGHCACAAGYSECFGLFGGLTCCPPDSICGLSHTCEKKCDPECSPCHTCINGECHVSSRSNGLSGQCSGGQVCCNGECVSEPCCAGEGNGLPCGNDMVCCSEQCVSNQCPDPKVFHYSSCSCECPPRRCPRGQHQDPDTCQCTISCNGQPDGTACGTNDVCCGGQCVDSCPEGKQLDPDSCTCVCPPVTCDSGQAQDPVTCQCVNRCTNVTCDTCQECDPGTGDCLPSDDGTECGDGLICQSGQCVPACSDLCMVYQDGQCVPAPNGTSCQGETGPTYECCNGECYHPVGVLCCAPDVATCGDTCCGTNEGCSYVQESDPNEYVCCPEGDEQIVGNALPGGACCPPGQDTFNMRDCPPDFPDRWICCPIEDDRGLTGCCSYG